MRILRRTVAAVAVSGYRVVKPGSHRHLRTVSATMTLVVS